MAREVALSTLAFLDVPAVEFIESAAAAGFDSVSLRVAGSAEPMRGEVADARALRAALGALRATGLGVVDVEVLRLGPALAADDVSRVIDYAAALGARHLLTVDGGWGETTALADQLADVAERADEAGIRACLEFMRFSGCGDLPSALAAAAPAGAAVLVDVLHLDRSGGRAGELADAVTDHGTAMFPYVQVCDAPARSPDPDSLRDEAVRDRLLPGDGDLPLAAVLEVLPATTPMAVEAPTRELSALASAPRAAATMRALQRTALSVA